MLINGAEFCSPSGFTSMSSCLLKQCISYMDCTGDFGLAKLLNTEELTSSVWTCIYLLCADYLVCVNMSTYKTVLKPYYCNTQPCPKFSDVCHVYNASTSHGNA